MQKGDKRAITTTDNEAAADSLEIQGFTTELCKHSALVSFIFLSAVSRVKSLSFRLRLKARQLNAAALHNRLRVDSKNENELASLHNIQCQGKIQANKQNVNKKFIQFNVARTTPMPKSRKANK